MHLHEYPVSKDSGIPEVLELLVTIFLSKKEMILVEGIFRIPAGKNDLNDLANAIT